MAIETFRSQFAALTGNLPFPWQERLFLSFQAGRFPSRCNIPTGLGKTSIMAVWLLALADEWGRADGALMIPRRLVYIVDRRSVVDQASEEAGKLLKMLKEPALSKKPILGPPASALHDAGLWHEDGPLALSTLRGALADNRRWLRDPSRPAIIIGTVDMIGSRLLFSGYGGLGRRGRSLHAGLLAQDTLIALDEAHLSHACATTLIELEKWVHRSTPATVGRPFHAMLLSATEAEARTEDHPPPSEPLEMDENDLADSIVASRFRAAKTLRFVEPTAEAGTAGKADKDAQERCMAAEAVRLAGHEGAVVVFASRVQSVDKIHDRIHELLKADFPNAPKEQMLLRFTGEMRGWERDALSASDEDGAEPEKEAAPAEGAKGQSGPPAPHPGRAVYRVFRQQRIERERTPRGHPVFLIATAAAEVGMNFDADHAVCDLVPLERMIQRLGRVNRFGDAAGGAQVSVVLPLDMEKLPNPGETKRTLDLLRGLLPALSAEGEPLPGAHSASPEALGELLKTPDAMSGAFTPASDPPPLDEARLDDWSLTSLRPVEFARPQVDYWLRGITPDESLTTKFAWRDDLRYAASEKDAADMAETFPLAPRELAQLPTFRAEGGAVDWLVQRAKKHLEQAAKQARNPRAGGAASPEKTPEDAEAEDKRLKNPPLGEFIAIRSSAGDWEGLELGDYRDKRERENLERKLIGATVLLPASFGGLKGGFPDKSSDDVDLDVAEKDDPNAVKLAPENVKRYRRALLVRESAKTWRAFDLREGRALEGVDPESSPADLCREIAGHFSKQDADKRKYRYVPREEEPAESAEDEETPQGPRYFVAYFAATGIDVEAPDAEDLASLQGKEVPLKEHNEDVENIARRFVEKLRLPAALADALIQAAAWHDLGKDRPQWQRAIDNSKKPPLAKSAKPRFDWKINAGYRHEFGSMMEAAEKLSKGEPRRDEPTRDLILHLIATHHGHGRPHFLEAAYDPARMSRDCADAEQEAELRFVRLQRRFGWWGLAYLEALLKCADGLASSGYKLDEPDAAAAPAVPPPTP